jgi:hypothetical protein
MSIFFHPNNPKYRRGVKLLSIYACAFVSLNIILADFGPQEHVFTDVKICYSQLFNITTNIFYLDPTIFISENRLLV